MPHTEKLRVAGHLVGAVDVAHQGVDPFLLGIVEPARLKVGQDRGDVDQVAVVEMLWESRSGREQEGPGVYR